jgi:dihydroorotate dehydrogenase electron transfer subunit
MIEVGRGYDPLLKRAFSLFRKTEDGLQIFYRVIGRGTALLGNTKEGECIDVLGPLGKPYPTVSTRSLPVVLAGGIGIASVYPLVEALRGRADVFFGARSKDELFFLSELQKMSGELFISTDDGSYGEKGTVVDLFKKAFSRNPADKKLFACGPRPMLKEIALYAVEKKIDAYVSLEEHMACGVGACLGCAVKVRGKMKTGSKKGEKKDSEVLFNKVCTDGPVFNVKEIVW